MWKGASRDLLWCLLFTQSISNSRFNGGLAMLIVGAIFVCCLCLSFTIVIRNDNAIEAISQMFAVLCAFTPCLTVLVFIVFGSVCIGTDGRLACTFEGGIEGGVRSLMMGVLPFAALCNICCMYSCPGGPQLRRVGAVRILAHRLTSQPPSRLPHL